MRTELHLDGLSKVDLQLQWIQEGLMKAAEVALMAATLPIENEAKLRAPKKTRTLSRSIHSKITKRTLRIVEAKIGTDIIYAKIQEFGGTIKPKNGKYLAIPVNSGKQYVSPKNFPTPLGFRRTKKGNGILIDAEGTTQFILVKSVEIPAKPYMRPAFDAKRNEAVQEFTEVMRHQIKRMLKGRYGGAT